MQNRKLPSVSGNSKREISFANKFPTPIEFMAGSNPDVIKGRYRHLINEKDCYLSNVIKLSELKNIYGEQTVFEYIGIWIINLNEFINIGEEKKMSNAQIQETAQYIYEDFFFLNIAEFAFIFKKIKKGEYGEFYNRIDGPTILKCFRTYRNKRGPVVVKIEKDKENIGPMADRLKNLASGLRKNREEMKIKGPMIFNIVESLIKK